jgi:DNA-binding transcriptional LysR family regulator
LELTPLRYFRTIAQHRHMTRAAQALGVTQPALSAVVKKLEQELGTGLLHRTGKGVELTEAGRVFLTHAEEAVRRADSGVKAVRELAGLDAGSIRVGGGATATAYLLPRVVSSVRAKHPALRFFVREAGSSTVASAVLSGELDLGIVTLPPRAKWGIPGAEDLLVLPLVDDELRLISPPGRSPASLIGSPRRRPTRAAPERRAPAPSARSGSTEGTFRWPELEGVPFVAFEAGAAVRSIIDQAAARAGVVLNVVMELRSIESIKQMVAAGIGVGLVSRFALAPGQGLVCEGTRLARKLAIIRRRDRVPSAAAGVFERTLVAQIGSEQGEPGRRAVTAG